MARRLTADAKIVLERAGYSVWEVGYRKTNTLRMEVTTTDNVGVSTLMIEGGTVDNDEVVKLLNARGYDEYGYKRV